MNDVELVWLQGYLVPDQNFPCPAYPVFTSFDRESYLANTDDQGKIESFEKRSNLEYYEGEVGGCRLYFKVGDFLDVAFSCSGEIFVGSRSEVKKELRNCLHKSDSPHEKWAIASYIRDSDLSLLCFDELLGAAINELPLSISYFESSIKEIVAQKLRENGTQLGLGKFFLRIDITGVKVVFEKGVGSANRRAVKSLCRSVWDGLENKGALFSRATDGFVLLPDSLIRETKGVNPAGDPPSDIDATWGGIVNGTLSSNAQYSFIATENYCFELVGHPNEPTLIPRFPIHSLFGLAASNDGQLVAVCSEPRKISISKNSTEISSIDLSGFCEVYFRALSKRILDSKIFACSDNGYIICISAVDGSLVFKKLVSNICLLSINVSSSGGLVAVGSSTGRVFVFDRYSQSLTTLSIKHSHFVWGCAVSQDSVASISEDGMLMFSNAFSGVLKGRLIIRRGRVRDLAFSSSGHLLLVLYSDTVYLVNAQSYQVIAERRLSGVVCGASASDLFDKSQTEQGDDGKSLLFQILFNKGRVMEIVGSKDGVLFREY